MKVQLVPIDSVTPYARNPRKNAGAVAKVAASLKEFGFRQPIVVDAERVVVVGHTRLEAARQLGMAKVPVHVAEGLTPAQVKAYRLADNRTAEEAEWDAALLGLELGDLAEADFDLALTGFSDEELAALTAEPSVTGEESADVDLTPPVEPKSKRGEVYQLGRHRVMCGDSTKVEDVTALLNGATPACMVTDPPYGVSYDPEWRNEAAAKGHLPFAARRTGRVLNDDRVDWTEAWELFPGDVVYCWHDGRRASEVQTSLLAAGFEVRSQIIWAKTHLAISRGHYHWQHEPCWYAVREGRTAHWIGDRAQTTLWSIPSPHQTGEDDGIDHGTPKPIECMERPLRNHDGDVYDPFLGTGTTLIAAERAGRTCYAMELSEAYCDVIRRRYAEFVGKPELAP